MSETLSVRPVRRDDYDRWLPLWDGYNEFYGRAGETALAPEITATTWARFFDAYEPVNAFVAERGDRLVGLVHHILHRSTTMIAPVLYLQDLFTAPDTRGQGVGRMLIEAVYDHARIVGAARVYWMTHETNATAMRLYDQVAERPGFVMYRRAI